MSHALPTRASKVALDEFDAIEENTIYGILYVIYIYRISTLFQTHRQNIHTIFGELRGFLFCFVHLSLTRS